MRAKTHHLRERIHDFVMMRRHLKWMLFIGVLLIACVVAILWYASLPFQWDVGFKAVNAKIRADSAIDFHFSRPMSREVEISIAPHIDGNWYFEERLSRLHLSRTFKFEPVQTWAPNTTYTITFHELRNVFSFSSEDMSYMFTSQPMPSVSVVSPVGSDAVSPQTPITLSLDAPNPGIAKIRLLTTPRANFSVALADDGKRLTYTPDSPLTQGTTYHVSVQRSPAVTFRDTGLVAYEGPAEEVSAFDVTTTEPPGITDMLPKGNVADRESGITIVFSNSPREEEIKKITIQPEVKGEWSLSENTAQFAPAEPLPYGTAFTVTIPKGLAMQNEGYLPEEVVHAFTTIGAVQVVEINPADSSAGVAVDRKIEITFDQDVDKDSAQKAIAISPAIETDVSWNGQTIIFSPKTPMKTDTTYTVTVESGIASIKGLPGVAKTVSTFSTEPSEVRLNVVFDRQDYPLSCEIATLKIALKTKGVSVTENQIINKIGFDSTPKKGNVWGDPHAAFVGDINGRQVSTGYGVYWEPIARVGGEYREAESFTNGTIALLTDEVSKGNPVIVWGNASSGKRVDWVTPAGKKIIAIIGEHTRVVKGYIGPKVNPIKIIVTDPLYGDIVYSPSTFDANWALLGRSGVIIR